MNRFLILVMLMASTLTMSAEDLKREFRGAWVSTIYRGFETRTTEQNQQYLTALLDSLDSAGINAVFFQVRLAADAFYESSIEPWSNYLTGAIGKKPSRYWDPLSFMVDECHKRGIELHAWLNPYRGPKVTDKLPANHLLKRHPERFVKYGKVWYFEPSLQVNRNHIANIVADITRRYDIDGIHFDDYFYPYPIAKLEFPDEKFYQATKSKLTKPDWRRQNIDLLIKQVSDTISAIKPWVRFGVSPFGIWRNKRTDASGSDTRGLQNYDDLYADVPKWAESGWIDYQIPQLYWQSGHKAAPYAVLCDWWAENGRGRHIYIGQDLEKTLEFDELDVKLESVRKHSAEKIQGNCWWYAASPALSTIGQQLKAKHYATKALVPEYLWKSANLSEAPVNVSFSGKEIKWEDDGNARRWVVYRFEKQNNIDIENPAAIESVTYTASYTPARPGVYVVTSLDYINGESAPSKPIIIRKI